MKVLSPAKISREEMLQCTAFSLIKELERLMILPNILHQSINVLYCVNNLKLFHVILCVDSTEESGIPPSLVQQILHLDAVLNVLDNTYMYCYGCNDGLCPGIMSRHGFLLSMVSFFNFPRELSTKLVSGGNLYRNCTSEQLHDIMVSNLIIP